MKRKALAIGTVGDNLAESEERKVLRLVKYDKNRNRLGDTSLKENTYEIFEAGSLRMTE